MNQLIKQISLVHEKTVLFPELLKILNTDRQPVQKIHGKDYIRKPDVIKGF